MSRYDNLRKLFSNYRIQQEQLEAYYRDLSATLALEFRSFLGGRDYFEEGGMRKAYVSAADAAWEASVGHFKFHLSPPTAIRIHPDGRFYFGLCVYLECSHDTPAQKPFVILLSAKKTRDDTQVRLEETDPKFFVHLSDPGGVGDLCGEIYSLIEDTLSLNRSPTPHAGFLGV